MRVMLKSVFARCRRGRLSLAGVVVVLSPGGSGQIAQGGENDKVTAKAHYEKGTRLYEIREYDKALLEYKAAYLAQPDPAFLFNIGQCYRKLGQNQEALSFFQEYLKKALLQAVVLLP
jgi:tetratricopeptide (TPR) repeat protein